MPACPRCGSINALSARFCSACGRALTADRLAQSLGRRDASVLFVDLVDSTRLVSELGPERFRKLQQMYFGRVRECIESHGGIVEKYIGDAVMAIFGVLDEQRHADRAASAALDILEMTRSLTEESDDVWSVELSARAGIDSGEVTLGDPATGQLIAAGDLVIGAARLQQSCGPNEVAVSQAAGVAMRGRFAFEKGTPASGLRIRSRSTPLFKRLRNPPFVGRVAERALLKETIDQTFASRSPRCVVLHGPAGIGKTRLARELVRVVPEVAIFRGRCLPYGRDMLGWFPITEIFDDLIDIHPNDSAGAVREKIAAFKRTTGGGFSEDSVFQLAGCSEEPPDVGKGVSTLADVMRACVDHQPSIIFFHDCQWASPEALQSIRALLHVSSRKGLLIVCLSRDPSFASQIDESGIDEIQLGELSEEEIQNLATGMTAAGGDPFLRRAVSLSRGNPLALQEYFWLCLQSESPEEALDALGESRERDPTLRDVVRLRLALCREQREALELAAVRGNYFWRGDVIGTGAAERGASSYNAALAALTKNGVIRFALDDRDDWFSFRHLVLCEEAYKSIPEDRRRELHGRCGRWLARALSNQWLYRTMADYHLSRAKGLRVPAFATDDGMEDQTF